MRSKGYWMKISYRNDNLSDDFICSFCRRHVYLEFLCDKCDYCMSEEDDYTCDEFESMIAGLYSTIE